MQTRTRRRIQEPRTVGIIMPAQQDDRMLSIAMERDVSRSRLYREAIDLYLLMTAQGSRTPVTGGAVINSSGE